MEASRLPCYREEQGEERMSKMKAALRSARLRRGNWRGVKPLGRALRIARAMKGSLEAAIVRSSRRSAFDEDLEPRLKKAR